MKYPTYEHRGGLPALAFHFFSRGTSGEPSPSPPFRGEREGPVAQRREGEVGGANHLAQRPPSPYPLPRLAGGEGKESVVETRLRQQTVFENP
jgi:hypothetical protein